MNGPLLRALRGEETPRRPVWLMRQAGRYLPEYRALRERYTFEELSGDPMLAAEVTLQPLARFPLDAAIVFADLLSPVGALGLDVAYEPGPVLERPVRTAADLAALRELDDGAIAPAVIGALKLVRAELDGEVALLGFAGAPWSLAAYLVEGRSVQGFPALRALVAHDLGLADALLGRLTDLVVRYLRLQVAAGADAVQLFDTWAGLLPLGRWTRLVRPHLVRLLDATRELGVPRILFLQDAPHLVEAYATLPAEALAVDWREDLAALRRRFDGTRALQGNLDPAVLLAGPGPTARATRDLLQRVPARGHVVNLGHGILPGTPLESVQALVDEVYAEALR